MAAIANVFNHLLYSSTRKKGVSHYRYVFMRIFGYVIAGLEMMVENSTAMKMFILGSML